MRIVALIARYLLGLAFLVFGANKLHPFLHMAMPTGAPLTYMGALISAHVLFVVALLEIIGGILLLVGRYVPLALVLLGPVIVNIVLFHVSLEPSGIPIAALIVLLWLLVFYSVRGNFAGIFAQKA
jgi:uncharacterized membrane protein YphA (DoxX/SURF4 family)